MPPYNIQNHGQSSSVGGNMNDICGNFGGRSGNEDSLPPVNDDGSATRIFLGETGILSPSDSVMILVKLCEYVLGRLTRW